MASSATEVQSAASNLAGADPATATLGAAPTEGNLLIVWGGERSGTDTSNISLSGITGWTETITLDLQQADSTYRRSHFMWWKVAGSGESSSVTYDDGTSNHKYVAISEYEHGGDGDQWSLLDSQSNSNVSTNDGTSLSTNATGSVSGEMFLVATMLIKRGQDTAANTVSWDSGLSEDQSHYHASNFDIDLAIGSDASDTVTGTKSSTGTLSDANGLKNRGLSAAILVFDIEAAAGGGPTIPVLAYHYNHNLR